MHETRIEIHEALQAVADIGRTLLPPCPDDSHHSFTWSAAHEAMVQGLVDGSFRPGLRLRDLTVVMIDAEGRVFTEFPLRGSSSSAQLQRMASLYAQAAEVLERLRERQPQASAVRLWPHHFDMALLIGTIGAGFVAGDDAIDEPYWYVTNTQTPDPLPRLSTGHWHRGEWTGPVLTGDPDGATIERFLDEAIRVMSAGAR